jgi:hypothetical protein
MNEFVPRQVESVVPLGLLGSSGDDMTALARWLMSQEGRADPWVRQWMNFLAVHCAQFKIIGELFPRENPGRQGMKDGIGVASSADELLMIANHLFIMRSHGVEGCVLECGCFKGYSSCCLSVACRRLGYPLIIADSFAGLPPGTETVGEDRYYQVGDFAGARPDVERNVRTLGDPIGVEYVEGWFSDTLKSWKRPLVLLWLDVDLLSSALDVLNPCLHHLEPRGAIFSHEFEAEHINNNKILYRLGPPAAIAQVIQEHDPDYWAEYVTGCLAIVGRHTSIGLKSHRLVNALLPSLRGFGRLSAADQTPAPGPPQSVYDGHHDVASLEQIAGWAWDRTRPETPIQVDIYDGDVLLSTVLADQLREDLKTAGIGNGRHGFVYQVPARLNDGKSHSIRIKFSGTSLDLMKTPKRLEYTQR